MWELNLPHGVSEIEPCGLSQREGSWFNSRSEISSTPRPGARPAASGGRGRFDSFQAALCGSGTGSPPPIR